MSKKKTVLEQKRKDNSSMDHNSMTTNDETTSRQHNKVGNSRSRFVKEGKRVAKLTKLGNRIGLLILAAVAGVAIYICGCFLLYPDNPELSSLADFIIAFMSLFILVISIVSHYIDEKTLSKLTPFFYLVIGVPVLALIFGLFFKSPELRSLVGRIMSFICLVVAIVSETKTVIKREYIMDKEKESNMQIPSLNPKRTTQKEM